MELSLGLMWGSYCSRFLSSSRSVRFWWSSIEDRREEVRDFEQRVLCMLGSVGMS